MIALWVTLAVVIGPWFPLMVLAWFWFFRWGHKGGTTAVRGTTGTSRRAA
jgi:hypothetical protein